MPGFARITHALVTICTSQPPTPGAHQLALFPPSSWPLGWTHSKLSTAHGQGTAILLARASRGLDHIQDWWRGQIGLSSTQTGPPCWDSADLKPAPWLERGPAIPGVRTSVTRPAGLFQREHGQNTGAKLRLTAGLRCSDVLNEDFYPAILSLFQILVHGWKLSIRGGSPSR